MVSEDFERLLMASKSSSTETLPWIWAIEALASSKHVNTSLLLDLVRKSPELSEDIGKNARELVSLRILETLFVQGNRNNNDDASVVGQKIEFDTSKSCEDVLRHILQEMSASNLKLGGSEMLKWDVQSFIAHKRDYLPMFALQKIKDAFLEGSLSILASLKERSGILVRTHCDDNIPGNSVNTNGSVHRLEERSEAQIVLPNQNLSLNATEYEVDELQEKLTDRNSLLSKRNRTYITAENLESEIHKDQITQDDCYDPDAGSAKKFKQDVNITEHAAVEKSMTSAMDGLFENSSERIVEYIDREGCTLEKESEIEGMEMGHIGSPHNAGDQYAAKKFKQDVNITENAAVEKPIRSATDGLFANSSERIVEHIDREGCNLEKEAEIGGTESEHTGSPHDGSEHYAALKILARSSDVVGAEDWNCQLQTSINNNKEVDMPGEVEGQSNCVDKANGCIGGFEERASNGTSLGLNEEDNNVNEAINSCHHNLQENTSSGPEANDDVEYNQVLETASDSDEYHDERNDIASKKNAFLSSQCTYSEDSLATQLNLCMKCNSGGQLLICSSNTCPLMVHESCLGSTAKFDGDGNFYCPFCAYSRAISEYLEVKRKASLARKDLSIFIGLKVGHRPKLSMRSHISKQNQIRGVGELCETNEANKDGDPLNEVNQSHWRPNLEGKLQVEPSISCAGNSLPSGEKVADLTHGELKTLEKGNLEGEGREQECHSPVGPGEHQIEVQALHKSLGDVSSHKQANIISRNERHIVTRGQKKATHPPESSLPSEPPSQTSCESSEEDDEKSAASKYSMRSRRPERQYTCPAIPQLRRKRHPWTKAEEEKLKEGVERFSSAYDLNIPWRTILEFGGNVFQKGRTTVDLKDKWRNICKGGSKSK